MNTQSLALAAVLLIAAACDKSTKTDVEPAPSATGEVKIGSGGVTAPGVDVGKGGVVVAPHTGPTPPPVGGSNETNATCPAGKTCSWDCTTGKCSQNCGAGSKCTSTCVGGGCTQVCGAGATCNFECSGGHCAQTCGAGATCTKTCIGGSCT